MDKEKKKKIGKIVNAVVMAVEIIIIIAGIALSFALISGAKGAEGKLADGYNLTVVLTDSMNGDVKDYKIKSFKAGDLVIVKKLEKEEIRNLQIGDVVTYLGIVNGDYNYITHRIINKEYREDLDTMYYETKGDAELNDFRRKYPEGQMQGIVTFVIPKLGYVVNWFQQSKNFLIFVVVPLAILLAYNIFVFIKMIMSAKIKALEEKNKEEIEQAKKKILQDIGEDKPQLDEEEIKKKAIEEYLASLKKESETPGN